MGLTRSKIKPNSPGYKNGSFEDSMSASQVDPYEDVELLLLRKTIERNPEIFILNNLMMCIQFFENYEENINQIKKTFVSSSEAALNRNMPPQKHVLIPDVLQEHVAQNVAFTSTRQTSRPTIEPLHPVRICVVHDNIEITEQNCTPEYSNINNQITYNMLMKPSENQGYVRLVLLDETPYTRSFNKRESLDPSAKEDDDMYSDTDSMYSRPKIIPSQQKSDFPIIKVSNVSSLPNLYDDKLSYKNQEYYSRESLFSRSSHDMKTESDYENTSSASEYRRHRDKRTWLKSEMATKPGSRHLRPSAMKSKKWNSPAGSTSSGYRTGHYTVDSDSDSSCHTVQSSSKFTNSVTESTFSNPKGYTNNTSADASETEIYSILNAKIPGRCFKKVMHTKEGKIYDPREEKKQLQNSKQRRLRTAMRRRNYEVSYISSLEFMKHFFNLFKDHLGQTLGFNQEDLDDVMVKPEGSVIYCDKLMISHNSRLCRLDSYEIMPSIWLQWPECAQEWLYRPRSTWPTYDDINKIKDFGCYVVPESSQMNINRNINHELEWQLIFPAAERYLETCMTHSQTQVYFIALMLHKTFLKPVFDSMYYLTTSNIRNKMFWLIEQEDRPSKWPENRTGECLIKLLKSLYRCLCQNEPVLWDYLIRDKNIFQKVPAEHLLHTQKQLKRILENPLMYVLHAMQNIRHSEKFFPRLNYDMLLKILTMDTLELVNPELSNYIRAPSSKSNESHMRDEIYNKSGGLWDGTKLQTRQKSYARVVTNKMLINPRKATDSIIEITVRSEELEGPRLSALLDFFVRHFIKMAERCHQYQAYQQKKVYLDQADRLSIILSEFVRYKADAKAYRDKICALGLRTHSRSQDEPPETPKRNGEAPIFASSLKDRFKRESDEPSAELSAEPKDEQPQPSCSNNEVRKNKLAQAIEVRFQQKSKEKTKENTAKTKQTNSEVTSILKKPAKENQNDESASETITKGTVALTTNENESFLTETTYI